MTQITNKMSSDVMSSACRPLLFFFKILFTSLYAVLFCDFACFTPFNFIDILCFASDYGSFSVL